MQGEKTVENKANILDGGNFKTKIGNILTLSGCSFNNAKKVTIEDRMKNLNTSGSGCRQFLSQSIIKTIIFLVNYHSLY
jgi:hypothetical protein